MADIMTEIQQAKASLNLPLYNQHPDVIMILQRLDLLEHSLQPAKLAEEAKPADPDAEAAEQPADQKPETNAKRNQTLIIEGLRKALKAEASVEAESTTKKIQLNKLAFDNAYFDTILSLQILLAKHWPLNMPDSSTMLLQDPITLEDIQNVNANEVIAMSNGYFYYKTTLNQYFANNSSFTVVNDQPVYKDHARTNLSTREVEYLKANGVTINPPNIPLANLAHQMGMVAQVAGPNQGQGVRRQAGFFARGYVIGLIIGFCALFALMILCPPLLPATTLTLFGAAAIAGVVGYARYPRGRRSLAMSAVMVGGLVVLSLASLVVPPLLGAIVGAVASHAAVTAAMAGWYLVQPLIIPTLFIAGLVKEYLKPEGLFIFFLPIATAPIFVCASIFGVIGYGIGALIEWYNRPRAPQLANANPNPNPNPNMNNNGNNNNPAPSYNNSHSQALNQLAQSPSRASSLYESNEDGAEYESSENEADSGLASSGNTPVALNRYMSLPSTTPAEESDASESIGLGAVVNNRT